MGACRESNDESARTGDADPAAATGVRARISVQGGALSRRAFGVLASGLLVLAACGRPEGPMDQAALEDFAARYTAAWCSQDPARVAAFYAPDGSLAINDGKPSVGRAAITAAARAFMTDLPDLVVTMDRVAVVGDRVEYHWTLTGTNTGPGGGGKSVRISGFEAWRMGADGLIAASQGHLDAAEYARQLQEGAPADGGGAKP